MYYYSDYFLSSCCFDFILIVFSQPPHKYYPNSCSGELELICEHCGSKNFAYYMQRQNLKCVIESIKIKLKDVQSSLLGGGVGEGGYEVM